MHLRVKLVRASFVERLRRGRVVSINMQYSAKSKRIYDVVWGSWSFEHGSLNWVLTMPLEWQLVLVITAAPCMNMDFDMESEDVDG